MILNHSFLQVFTYRFTTYTTEIPTYLHITKIKNVSNITIYK